MPGDNQVDLAAYERSVETLSGAEQSLEIAQAVKDESIESLRDSVAELIKQIKSCEELEPFEKIGWLDAIYNRRQRDQLETEVLQKTAETNIGNLYRVGKKLEEPGQLILTCKRGDKPHRGKYELSTSDEDGLRVTYPAEGSRSSYDHMSIDVTNKGRFLVSPSRVYEYISARDVMDALISPEDIETSDDPLHLRDRGHEEPIRYGTALVIGEENIKSLILKELESPDLEERKEDLIYLYETGRRYRQFRDGELPLLDQKIEEWRLNKALEYAVNMVDLSIGVDERFRTSTASMAQFDEDPIVEALELTREFVFQQAHAYSQRVFDTVQKRISHRQ